MRNRRESGQTLPFMAVTLVMILGFIGLATDVGYLFFQERLEQTAADAGAVAGANELFYSSNIVNITDAAQNATAVNGYTHNGGSVVVTVNNPPSAIAGDPYNGNTSAVEVIVNAQQPTFFMRVLGFGNVPVVTRAVGILSATDNGCLYLLNQTSSSTKNGATIDAPNCSILTNSPTRFNGGTVDVQGIGYSGTFSSSGGVKYTAGTPQQLASPVTDPCFQIPGCEQLASGTAPSTSPCNADPQPSGGQTINPGCYQSISVSKGGATLNPGLYVITGSLNVSSNSNSATGCGSTLCGSGVTLYFTGTGSLSVTNGATIDLAACTTTLTPNITCQQGAVNNMLVYAPSATGFTLNGGGATLAGVVYAPNATGATLNGNGQGRTYSSFILGSMSINGNNVTFADSGPPPGESYILHPVLGE
jgi:hypothetical protein